jgi:hypothetical protein
MPSAIAAMMRGEEGEGASRRMCRTMAVLGLGMVVSVSPTDHDRYERGREPACGTASGINNAISRIAGMLAIDAATNAAVRADREARFFTICSSYAPILNQRRQSGDEMAGQSDIEWSEDVLDQ